MKRRWFKNNSFVEWTGDVNQPLRSWASTVPTTGLFQDETFDGALSNNAPPASDLYTQMIGGGIDVYDTRGNLHVAQDAYFGSEVTTAGYIGGYMAGFGPWLVRSEEVLKYDDAGALVSANLDLKNPNGPQDAERLPPEQLVDDILKKEQQIAELVTEINVRSICANRE